MFISECFDDANLWLGIIYSVLLLDCYYSNRIDNFTITDRDRLNLFETYYDTCVYFIAVHFGRAYPPYYNHGKLFKNALQCEEGMLGVC